MKMSASERRKKEKEREERREKRGHAGGQKAGWRQSDKKDEEQGEFREETAVEVEKVVVGWGGVDRSGGGVITSRTGRQRVSIEPPSVNSIRHVQQQPPLAPLSEYQ